MPKYAELGSFLKRQKSREVPMSFSEIERVTGQPLPPSARRHRPWWSNNARNSVMTRVWLDAGFKTEQVDMAGEKLLFRRVQDGEPRLGAVMNDLPNPGATIDRLREPVAVTSLEASPRRHPLFGCMKGTVTVAPGFDLTEPADPDWGRGD